MPRLAPVTTQTLSWSSRSIAPGKLPGMRPAAVRRRALAALAARWPLRRSRWPRSASPAATARCAACPDPDRAPRRPRPPGPADARRRRRRPPVGPRPALPAAPATGVGRLRDPGARLGRARAPRRVLRRGRVRDAPAADRARAHPRRPGAVAAVGDRRPRGAPGRDATERVLLPGPPRHAASSPPTCTDGRGAGPAASGGRGDGHARPRRAGQAGPMAAVRPPARAPRRGRAGRLVTGSAARALLRDAV